jgi:hypothetical protein
MSVRSIVILTVSPGFLVSRALNRSASLVMSSLLIFTMMSPSSMNPARLRAVPLKPAASAADPAVSDNHYRSSNAQ